MNKQRFTALALPIVGAVLLLIAAIGCGTGGDDSASFGRGDFTVGEDELIYTRAQREAKGLFGWPDGTMGWYHEGGGTYAFYGPDFTDEKDDIAISLTVGTLDNPAGNDPKTIVTVSNVKVPRNNYDYISAGPVYRLDENTMLLIYHMEQPVPYGEGRAYCVLGAAVSTSKDGNGRFTSFKDLGLIISPSKPFSNKFFQDLVDGYAFDIIMGEFAVYNGYFYMYFKDTNNDPEIWDPENQLAVARASIEEIRAAVNEDRAPVFRKYYNGGWTEDGLGGKSSELKKENHGTNWLDVSYNTYLNKFLMVVSWDFQWKQDLFLLVSDDGINWSDTYRIANEAGALTYPTIVGGPEAGQRETGKDFSVYYTRSINATIGGDMWADIELVRRKITLN